MRISIDNVTKHCANLISTSRCNQLPFHNLKHTLDVYNNIITIGDYEHLPESDIDELCIAALFHDTGNAFRFKGHEEVSALYAKNYLEKQQLESFKIDRICSYILATTTPQTPKNSNECVICDADLFHLGTPQFLSRNKLLRIEWKNYLDINYSDEIWIKMNIDFLSQHHFFTSYGKEILEPIKTENINILKSYL